jgi:lipopolysaccharide transport system permease protein
MFNSIKEVLDRRELLYMITRREIIIKYKQSIMGMLWAVLMPSIIVCAGLVVRYAFAATSGKSLEMSDLTAVAVKATPWAFFVSAIRFGTTSLIGNANLVTKIYMPRLVFPLAAVFSQLFDFLIAGAVVTLFLVVVGVELSVQLFWVPLLIGTLIVLAAALAIIFSAASLFFRDVKYIVDVLLTFAIFFTPVFYESSMFGSWAPALLANPASPLLEAMSSTIVLHEAPPLGWLCYSVLFSGSLLTLGIVVFKKLEPYFAECI